MAMINCEQCNKPVSDDARTCPNCGTRSIRSFGMSNRTKGLIAVVVVVVAIVLFILHDMGTFNDGVCNTPRCENKATIVKGSDERCRPCALDLIDRYG